MGDLGKREIDILREKLGNSSSSFRSKPAIVPQDHSGTEHVRMAQPDVVSTGERSSDLDFLLDEDSGSEYGDVVVPTKRKRRTNNSFALDLDDDSSEIALPPPPKRLQFSMNGKESSVLIGVWKESPPSDPAKKHAVYAFIDNADRVRQKVYPETQDGEAFHDGYPSGTGRAFVPPEFVILDPQLSPLSRQELKEYIRIRMSHRQNESPEERKKAEALAIEEAKKVAAKNTAIPIPRSAPSTPVTHSKPAKPAAPNTLKGGIPNGVFLGFWKDSDAVEDINKHAAFGVVDSNRLRVKVIKFTRDGRPYQGNFPTNPGSNWVPFDDVVREPALDKLLRLEVIEYVKIRQNDKLQRPSDFDPFGVDADAIKKAIETFAVMAKAQGLSAAKLDAQNEASRKAHNESRAAMKANPVLTKGWKYESPYAKTTPDNSRTQDPKVREEGLATGQRVETHMARTNEKVVTTPRGTEATGVRESPSVTSSSKNDLPAPKSNASEVMTGASKTDTPEGKAKAIRSKKAEADATAEKLRRVREAAAAKAKESAKGHEIPKEAVIDKEVVRSGRDREETSEGLKGRTARTAQELARQVKETDQAMSKRGEERARTIEQANGNSARREVAKQDDIAKQGDSMTPRQRAIKEAEAKERELRAKEAKEAKDREEREHEAAQARAEMEKAMAEIEKAKADAIESVSNEFFSNTDSFEERANARSEGHRTVGPSPDPVAPMNRSQPSVDVKIHNDVKYVRQERGPFAGMLVGEKREFLTIDGENYVECRILMRMEF
jgi:hypothetical protein